MHSDDALRRLDCCRDRRHRQRGGVGGQDHFRRARVRQAREQFTLHVEVLGSGLDHEIAAAQILERGGEGQAFSGGVGVGVGHATPPCGARKSLEQSLTPGVEGFRDGIVKERFEAPAAGQLSNACTHGSGADDADAAHGHGGDGGLSPSQ